MVYCKLFVLVVILATMSIHSASAYTPQKPYGDDIYRPSRPYPAEACECNGTGEPCRNTYYGNRFCYINNPYACNSAQESELISGVFWSTEPCINEVHKAFKGKRPIPELENNGDLEQTGINFPSFD